MRVRNNDAPADVFSVEGPELPLIPPGTYDAKFDYHETARMFGRAPKLILWFRVMTMGEHFNTKLPRYYNAKAIRSKPRRSGGFAIGRKSAFLREYLGLFDRPGLRLDRLSMSEYRDKLFEVSVRTVKRGSHECDIPRRLQYSVIDEVLRVKQL